MISRILMITDEKRKYTEGKKKYQVNFVFKIGKDGHLEKLLKIMDNKGKDLDISKFKPGVITVIKSRSDEFASYPGQIPKHFQDFKKINESRMAYGKKVKITYIVEEKPIY